MSGPRLLTLTIGRNFTGCAFLVAPAGPYARNIGLTIWQVSLRALFLRLALVSGNAVRQFLTTKSKFGKGLLPFMMAPGIQPEKLVTWRR